MFIFQLQSLQKEQAGKQALTVTDPARLAILLPKLRNAMEGAYDEQVSQATLAQMNRK